MNKELFSGESILALKQNRTYPPHTSTSVLKWRYTSKDESQMPLTRKNFAFWYLF